MKKLFLSMMLAGFLLPAVSAFSATEATRKYETKTNPDTGQEYVDCTAKGTNCTVEAALFELQLR